MNYLLACDISNLGVLVILYLGVVVGMCIGHSFTVIMGRTKKYNLEQAVEEMRKFALGGTADRYERMQKDGVDRAIRILDKYGLLND